jgi:hypothetical protein
MVERARPVNIGYGDPGALTAVRTGVPDRYNGGGPVSRNGRGVESGPVGRLLSEIVPERVGWLWPGRIPKGKLTICEGDSGEGKSAMTTDFAARVSIGSTWPDGTKCEAAGVLRCSPEDGEADTIGPRLDAAGGDASKVLVLATISDGSSERLLSVPEEERVDPCPSGRGFPCFRVWLVGALPGYPPYSMGVSRSVRISAGRLRSAATTSPR